MERLETGVRQLFLDDALIERAEGLKRVLHQPVKFPGNPIIGNDRPWQTYRAQIYGTALYDPASRRFKLWYLAGARLPSEEPVRIDGRLRCPNFQSVGYATSADGFHFELPHLGLVEFNGSTANNLCRIGRECVEGIAVLHQPDEPEPGRRYQCLYWEHSVPYRDEPVVPVNGICVSVSGDGVTWTDAAPNPVMALGSDTGQQLVWDAHRQRYVAYGRFGAKGSRGRCVTRSESPDLVQWSAPRVVFEADDADGAGTQIYGMGVTLYEGIYLGLPWIFREGSAWNIDVQLASSRDGIHWQRVAGRETFLPNGPEGSWEAGIIFTATRPVLVEDTLYFYYSACRHNHDYRLPEEQRTADWWSSIKTSIGVATLRRDGFVSLDAGDEPGHILTRPLLLPEAEMHLNVDARGGEVRVALLDEAGRPLPGFARSAPIAGDCLNTLVRWPAADERGLIGRPVRVRIDARNACLYSYWFDAPAP
jgi:hypothetical protein